MFVYKIDEEISLKLVELKDAERVFELTDNSREYLREWLPWLDMTTSVEDTKGFIKSCLKSYAENKSITTFILFKGEIVGTASYNEIDWANKIAYIGYWLGKVYQGNGIMVRVARALTDYAFNALELNKVDISAAVENKRSRSIPERLGFVNEGCIRQAEWLYDHYVDHIVYGMLAEDWKSNNSPY
ncbi:GNAT family N-acetyltransferase [Aquibacillus sp. 3ASR75-11]|uniref:GNAT family N-acetyltransferase n=1 Tax=Terrihalobacillus insolitus TaxID=2950438 RepID=A0A9X3WTX7_9BACI|nr:GNAT family protein [Terrihalobacillus insolitus]MDC3414711.1 GNAT family N-acetyltransferase [Terrihalobacillus insolitus]MDC3424176.1 GNAT family N-acetyltransferase [Terrihalobacillus insolitus]